MLRNQERENIDQKHKDQGLDEPHQDFQKVKRNRKQPGQIWDHVRHHVENTFARVNVSKQTKAERNRPKKNPDDFQPTDQEEDDDHQYFEDAGRLTFWAKQVHQESSDTIRLKCPNKPENKEDNGHRRSQVEIGVGATEQRAINLKGAARRIDMSPTHGPDPWNQSRPVGKQDKNENGGEKPEGFLYQLMSDD